MASDEFGLLPAAARASELAIEENERLVDATTLAQRAFAVVMEEGIKGKGSSMTSDWGGAKIPGGLAGFYGELRSCCCFGHMHA